jgi:predicted RNA binding protein YcfA (HicA-like mRNA interferase family)
MSASEVIAVFKSFGFEVQDQNGSHIKMSRRTILQKQIIIVPNHKSIAKGTLHSVYKQASKYLPQEQLQTFFYND